jgi:hypothetical protein
MKPLRPDTFMLTLPNGEKVRCWRREADAIRADVARTGSVILVRDPATEVYDRIAPHSAEAPVARASGRHV